MISKNYEKSQRDKQKDISFAGVETREWSCATASTTTFSFAVTKGNIIASVSKGDCSVSATQDLVLTAAVSYDEDNKSAKQL